MITDIPDFTTLRRRRTRSGGHIAWQTRLEDFTESLVRVRMLRAFNRSAARYPVFRSFVTTIIRPMDDVLDDFALRGELVAQRLDATHLLLDGEGVFVSIRGRKVAIGSSLTVEIWAQSIARLEAVRDRLQALGGEQVRRREMFTIDWQFNAAHGLSGVSFDEAAEPPLL